MATAARRGGWQSAAARRAPRWAEAGLSLSVMFPSLCCSCRREKIGDISECVLSDSLDLDSALASCSLPGFSSCVYLDRMPLEKSSEPTVSRHNLLSG